MTNSTQVTPFIWGDIDLSQTVLIDGVPHATRAAIGEWLEYDDPAEGVRKLLNRNSYIEDHSVQVKLTGTDGKNYDTLVYHPIGFLLIVMESGQPKAQEMKQAVAEFVWHFAGPCQMSNRTRMELLKFRTAIIERLAKTRDAFARACHLADLREVSLALGCAVPDVALLGTDVKQPVLPGV